MPVSSLLEFELHHENNGEPQKGLPGSLTISFDSPYISERPVCYLHLQLKTLRFKEVKSFAQEQTIRKMSERGFEIEHHVTPYAGR